MSAYYSSSKKILPSSFNKTFKIVNYLIRERLHGFPARPGDVWRDDQVRQLEIEQRVSMTRRLFTQRVKSGSRNQTVLQRINQSRIIDQRAARGVNQQRTPLHH